MPYGEDRLGRNFDSEIIIKKLECIKLLLVIAVISIIGSI